jgi:hypothetical protein
MKAEKGERVYVRLHVSFEILDRFRLNLALEFIHQKPSKEDNFGSYRSKIIPTFHGVKIEIHGLSSNGHVTQDELFLGGTEVRKIFES